MEKIKKEQVTKRAYQKPVLRAVSIAAGTQTLDTGCKLSGADPNGQGHNLCLARVCFATAGTS